MSERIITTILFMASFLLSFSAAPVVYEGCIPSSGSEISSWEFTLKFDISKAVDEAGDGEFGIGYTAATGMRAALYLVEGSEKTLLGTTLTTKYIGNSDNFKINNDLVNFSFESSIPILEGREYEIEITNTFGLFKSGKGVAVSGTNLKFLGNPLVLKFIGAKSSEDVLSLVECSIEGNSELDQLDSFVIKFNNPIDIVNNSGVILSENGSKIASANITVDKEDSTRALITFPLKLALLKGHNYQITLTEGAISLASHPNILNTELSWSISGNGVIYISNLSNTPNNGSIALTNKVEIYFDIPTGYTLTAPEGRSYKCSGYLYKKKVSEENLIGSYYGKISSNGNGQIFDISNISQEPVTEYIFVTPADNLTVWKDNQQCAEYINKEEIKVSWTTPSVEDLGLNPIKIGTVKVGRHDNSSSPEFIDGATYANINTLEIKKEDYSYEGETIKTTLDWDNLKTFVYDVTNGSRVFVKEMEIGAAQRESNYDYYGVFVIAPMMDFLQGHTYEIVIPKGVLRLSGNKTLYNYVTNDEIVFTVKGATPAEFLVEACSIANNAEMSSLPSAIVWTLSGAYELTSNNVFATAKFSGTLVGNSQYPITLFKDGWKTYASVQLSNVKTGEIAKIIKDSYLTITIPAGSIVYPTDETLCNPELSVTIKGIDTPVEVPEFVNTTVTLADEETNEAHSIIVETVKGYPAKIQMLPGENWNVADVAHEGKSLTAVNGVYTSEPLTADSKIVATLAFNKDMQFDQTTGVYSVEDTNIKVYTENNQIVISGLTQPTNIAVYSVGGILVKQMTTEAAYDMVRISAEPNEIYVVVINGQAAKVKL